MSNSTYEVHHKKTRISKRWKCILTIFRKSISFCRVLRRTSWKIASIPCARATCCWFLPTNFISLTSKTPQWRTKGLLCGLINDIWNASQPQKQTWTPVFAGARSQRFSYPQQCGFGQNPPYSGRFFRFTNRRLRRGHRKRGAHKDFACVAGTVFLAKPRRFHHIGKSKSLRDKSHWLYFRTYLARSFPGCNRVCVVRGQILLRAHFQGIHQHFPPPIYP